MHSTGVLVGPTGADSLEIKRKEQATLPAFWYAEEVPNGFSLAGKQRGTERAWVSESFA
jgi:hypothetical protein